MTEVTGQLGTVANIVAESRKLLRKSRPDESLQLLKRAYELEKTNYDVISGIAEILALGSASLEAIQWCKRAILLSPSRTPAYNWLQRASSRAILRATLKFGTWAIIVQPDNPLGHLFLATFLRNSGRPTDSELYYRASVALLPILGEPYFRLGSIKHTMDNPNEAKKNYVRAKILGFRHMELQKALANVETALSKRNAHRSKRINRWPENTNAFENIEKILVDCLPNISPWTTAPLKATSTVFTLGSCFAQNIAQVLLSQKIPTTHLPLSENFNTSSANLRILRYILQNNQDDNKNNLRNLFSSEDRAKIKNRILNCDVMIYTMGVSPAFFDRNSGEQIVPTGDTHALTLIRDHEFRTTTVGENVDNLKSIIELVREVNPETHIVLSVSPIPLTATFEMDSAIIADCVSKSIMRAATHEILTERPMNVSYWPSFEIVKWTAPHRGRSFGDDDGSSIHVNRDLLSTIFECFVEYYSEGGIKTQSTSREAFSNTKRRYSIN